jgi:hypothetical protein
MHCSPTIFTLAAPKGRGRFSLVALGGADPGRR